MTFSPTLFPATNLRCCLASVIYWGKKTVDFVKTDLCKLCVILPSRILRVLFGCIQDIYPVYEEDLEHQI